MISLFRDSTVPNVNLIKTSVGDIFDLVIVCCVVTSSIVFLPLLMNDVDDIFVYPCCQYQINQTYCQKYTSCVAVYKKCLNSLAFFSWRMTVWQFHYIFGVWIFFITLSRKLIFLLLFIVWQVVKHFTPCLSIFITRIHRRKKSRVSITLLRTCSGICPSPRINK